MRRLADAHRRPIFVAAKARGATFVTNADVDVLDRGIDEAFASALVDEPRLAEVLRGLFGKFDQAAWDAIAAVVRNEPLPASSPAVFAQVGLTAGDFAKAAARLGCTVAQIRAVDEVESGGGWFTDPRADILALDGPGGFIDGPNLPKILFEAHKFDDFTNGRYRSEAPNLSSQTWNRALYVGGQGEWTRLHRAMLLDTQAALMSASVGRYQIMGFNHKLAGYATVQAFWAAMKTTERAHLEAFVTFIVSTNLGDELRRVSDDPKTCEAFTAGYNGKGQVPIYSKRIAEAHRKFRLAA
jgi:hypothetical protein